MRDIQIDDWHWELSQVGIGLSSVYWAYILGSLDSLYYFLYSLLLGILLSAQQINHIRIVICIEFLQLFTQAQKLKQTIKNCKKSLAFFLCLFKLWLSLNTGISFRSVNEFSLESNKELIPLIKFNNLYLLQTLGRNSCKSLYHIRLSIFLLMKSSTKP